MNAKSKVERTLKQVETGVQPNFVNGVAVDQLVQTINAIKATRPSRNSSFAFAINGQRELAIARAWIRTMALARIYLDRSRSCSKQTSRQSCSGRTPLPIQWNICFTLWPRV